MYSNHPVGMLSRGIQLLKSIDFAGILDGTSKTLNVVNQAIPVFYQAKPFLQNMGTLFQIKNAIKKDSIEKTPFQEEKKNSSISPIFYL